TRGMNPHRQLHFTFDDGPRLDTTPQLLEHLDDFGIRATFFLVTRGFDGTNRVDRAKAALAQDIARRGHTIGGHTHTHPNLTRLKLVEIQDELNRAEATFEAVFGARPVLFRAPYGARNRRVNGELRRRGYTHVLWNITSGDTTSRRPQDIVDAFERSLDIRERHPLGPGGIVLLHDTNPRVVEAFPAMVRVLQRRNCELLDAGEELWDVLDTPEAFITLRGEEASTERDEASREARQEVLIAATAERCADERSQDALVDSHL
ncbi:MAG: polysaccharide deacetylase family protein, partial [Myxococcota bacterium]